MAGMGIFSRRHRRRTPDQSQPGAGASSPLDLQGDGPVGLGDRTRPDAQGSPDTNQGKTEPIPPTGKQADPDPDKDATSVGSAPSQLPSPPGLPVAPVPAPAAAASDGPRNPGAPPADERPVVDPRTSSGPHGHVTDTPGPSRRAPLSQGESPEEQESDVTAGAARMSASEGSALAGPDGSAAGSGGDAQGVPSLGEISSGGTSEQMAPVQGVRTALPPQPAD